MTNSRPPLFYRRSCRYPSIRRRFLLIEMNLLTHRAILARFHSRLPCIAHRVLLRN